MKRVGKLVIQVFLGIVISVVLHRINMYPLGKIFLIVGVLYLMFGSFGLIDLISSNGVANIFTQGKDLSRVDPIGKIIDSSSSNEALSRFFPKKEKDNLGALITIIAGFILISLEYFSK